MKIELKLLSEKFIEGVTYDERVRTYSCPCGEGEVVWSKERPNGKGFGYQATFSDAFCYCDKCKGTYDFSSNKGYAVLK